jgi:hypothetical protein
LKRTPRRTRKMPESKVVDAWALLAWLRDEQPSAFGVPDRKPTMGMSNSP